MSTEINLPQAGLRGKYSEHSDVIKLNDKTYQAMRYDVRLENRNLSSVYRDTSSGEWIYNLLESSPRVQDEIRNVIDQIEGRKPVNTNYFGD